MKNIVIILIASAFFFGHLHGAKIVETVPPPLPESFTYGRIGVFGLSVVPLGGEAAIGHRFRSETRGVGGP